MALATHLDSSLVVQEIARGQGLSLAQASRLIPGHNTNRHAAPSTVWRWATQGIPLPDGRRLKLETARLGCRWLTSQAAIERFLRAQNPTAEAAPDAAAAPAPVVSKVQEQRRRTADDAARILEEAGI